MAYCNANPYQATPTRVLCNDCAELEISFTHGTDRHGPYKFATAPWCWVRTYGKPCETCAADC